MNIRVTVSPRIKFSLICTDKQFMPKYLKRNTRVRTIQHINV